MSEQTTKIKIPPYAKIKVFWDDKPENYSKENKTMVRNHFAQKYGIQKTNINVIYRPIKIGKNGEAIEISGAGIENIMDTGYQRELFKEWLQREGKEVDFDRLMKLDDKVNAELNIESNDVTHRTWSLNWIMINGFLCFGPNNYVSLSNLHGLTIINSLPENQGGKTTFSIDAVKYLLYGKTTKTDKNEQIFNQYWDNNELIVRGMVTIGDKDIIIERIMTRKSKRSGEWTVTNELNYYEILPDGEEIQLNEEDAKETTKEIKNTIGNEDDFELVTLATARNLDDLVGLSTTESGKLLTRFIGLEVIENKSEISRKMYNEFAKTKKSNIYDIITLKNEIDGYNDGIQYVNGHKDKIDLAKKLLETLSEESISNDELIKKYNSDKDTHIGSKKQIDSEILTLNPSKLNEEIQEITNKGVEMDTKKTNLNKEILKLKPIKFDEDYHQSLVVKKNKLTTDSALKTAEITRLTTAIDLLEKSGICQSCNRPLDNIDNSKHIEQHRNDIKVNQTALDLVNNDLLNTQKELDDLTETKSKVDSRDKLEIEVDRLEIDITNLRTKYKSKNEDLKKYNSNIDAIEFNKDIDTKIEMVKTKLLICDNTKTELTQKMERAKMDITQNETDIKTKESIIEQIKKEDEIDKLFKVYIDMVGKKGISKLVLRSVLPIINSEVQRLLDEVVDFEVEIFINDKNDVQFMLIKDDIEKYLKSGSGLETTAASIALRCVLGKMSCLPMPNFITFDEVLGKVAQVNIPKMKPLFDKITDMYDTVFFITHNDEVKDWADSIITIKKENNISSIYVK
jgi:DNA repair exonuclease SbcCD ATPase subunit